MTELLKKAFIEGYKQRAEGSDFIFDETSEMYAEHIFEKWIKGQKLPIDSVSTRFLFEWFDKQLETKKWETYADSKDEAETKFKNRTYLMENSYDGKYKCYSINVR